MVSKNSNRKLMQACKACVSCRVIFIATRTAQWQQINNGIPKPVSPPSLSHSIWGITTCRHHSPLANHVKKTATVSFVCGFMFFSPTPNVFSPQPFSIKLQFCCRRRRPSLSPQGDNSSLPPSLAQKCHREASSGEFVCCFYPPPQPSYQYFLMAAFFN